MNMDGRDEMMDVFMIELNQEDWMNEWMKHEYM